MRNRENNLLEFWLDAGCNVVSCEPCDCSAIGWWAGIGAGLPLSFSAQLPTEAAGLYAIGMLFPGDRGMAPGFGLKFESPARIP